MHDLREQKPNEQYQFTLRSASARWRAGADWMVAWDVAGFLGMLTRSWRSWWVRWGPAAIALILCASVPFTVWWVADRKAEPIASSREDSGRRPISYGEIRAAKAVPDSSEVNHRDDEPTEYLPAVFGFRLKATDTLLVLFTFVLALFTGGLWRSTTKLWLAGERQSRLIRMSTDAAKKSADVAEASLVKLERPFVFIGGIPWFWHDDWSRPGKYWYSIRPILENSGNTPTIGLRVSVRYELRDDPLPDNFKFDIDLGTEPSLIRPKGSIGISNGVILDEDLVAIQEGRKHYYMWGVAVYGDGFDGTQDHVTKFSSHIARVLGNPLDPQLPGDPQRKGTSVEIVFEMLPGHNSAT